MQQNESSQSHVRFAITVPDSDDETTALLRSPTPPTPKKRAPNLFWFWVTFVVLIGIAIVIRVVTLPKPRSVILMISDGFGPASQTFARQYEQYTKNDYSITLGLDSILIGSSRTRSSSSLVTDSAAGATAFSCAMKTYNGGIGVDENQIPCGTVLESAKLKGYSTGLIATSRISHATPASFAAHVPLRDMEDLISLQLINGTGIGGVDLLLGGGECHFLPNTTMGSCREDSLDLKKIAKSNGWTFASIDDEFKDDKIIGLFAKDHMDYNIDRTDQPSLLEMTIKGLDFLRRKNTGFFVMIEGSRIDMAGHSNDPATHLKEVLHYNKVVEYVKSFVDANPGTVMISVSDHETGGFSVAKQLDWLYPEYLWKPEHLVNVKNSSEVIARKLFAMPVNERKSFVKETVAKEWLGINDITEYELGAFDIDNYWVIEGSLGMMQSNRAQLGWATHGHSAVDVNLYGYGSDPSTYKELVGNHENTEIGDFIAKYLGLDLQTVTDQLKGQRMWTEDDKTMGLRKQSEKDIHQAKQEGFEAHFHQV